MKVCVECKPDEITVVALGVSKPNVTHYSGKGTLCKALTRDKSVLAMLDEDPLSAQPSYLKKLEKSEERDGLKTAIDGQRSNRIVLICPRLEDWLMSAAKLADLNLRDFGFQANNSTALHGEINKRLGSLQRLIVRLLEAKSPRLLRLKDLLIR